MESRGESRWLLCQYQDHEGVGAGARPEPALCERAALSRNDLNPQASGGCPATMRGGVIAWCDWTVGTGDFAVRGPTIRRCIPPPDTASVFPRRGFWKEVINTNSEYYGGSGQGNDGAG